MCKDPNQLKLQSSSSSRRDTFVVEDMNNSVSGSENRRYISLLLECAADNNIDGFKQCKNEDSMVSDVGLWYGRQKETNRMVLELRTPLMVGARYGSVGVVKMILDETVAGVNFHSGMDNSTALHCAASSGSANVVEIIQLLLLAGADPNEVNAYHQRPIDVIVSPQNLSSLKPAIEELLKNHGSASPPISCKVNGASVVSVKKGYPVDPSLPDISNSFYATDEFRMFSFKIRPCSRAYSHDWTECPFVHPGENARRRDPRKFHYSCVPCSDHRKGGCKRGDLCEYAHGIFECWLHPAQYRTRLCKEGSNCCRRVCFFAHSPDELRPVYVPAGTGLPASPPPFSPPPSPSCNDLRPSFFSHNLHANVLKNSFCGRESFGKEFHGLHDIQFHHPNLLKTLSIVDLDKRISSEISSPLASTTRFSPSLVSGACPYGSEVKAKDETLVNTDLFSPHISFSSPMNRINKPLQLTSSPLSNLHQHAPFRSPISRELGSDPQNHTGFPRRNPIGKLYSIPAGGEDEIGLLDESFPAWNGGEEPDLSWIQSVLKETPSEGKGNDVLDAIDGPSSWVDLLQRDQIVAQ